MTLIFFIDICLNFALMYPAHATSTYAAGWVSNPRRIAKNYLSTWFAVDFVSVAVSFFDFLAICFGAADECEAAKMATGTNLTNMRVLRALRALRLLKLARILRASRILKRWETRVTIVRQPVPKHRRRQLAPSIVPRISLSSIATTMTVLYAAASL